MLEITIQRRVGGRWPVVAERHRPETLLPVRSEGWLELADEPSSSLARTYGTALGQALLRDAIRDALIQARSDQPDGVRVLLFIEADELKAWRWEWLCAPVDSTTWDFLGLDQRVLYSLYLPSLTDRAYPPIGRNDLRALVVVANPADPEKKYGLASFDVGQNVARLRSVFGERAPATALARAAGAAGAPTLAAIETHLTRGTPDGPYTILHLVCHGWVNPQGGEISLYLERPGADPANCQVLAQPVQGSELIERLRRIGRLPYLVFLSTCESAVPEAEQRLGGLAQRLVRELGIPAVVGMTERVTIATAHALAEQFYNRLFAQISAGEVDRALVEAYAGLAARSDINVPALYSRLGTQPLFSTALDRPLTAAEIKAGLRNLDDLLAKRAPVLRPRLAESVGQLRSTLETSPEALSASARQERDRALTRVNELCSEAVEISFNALAQGESPPTYDGRQPFRGLSPFRAEDREFFFGRDSLVEKLQNKLCADNFLAVLGPSGSGKSSLVLAGLAPQLKAQIPGLQVVDDLTPGSAPLEQLRVRQSKLGPGPILYIVDQFEELFTLGKDEGQRRAFIDELLNLAQRHRVVLTMRADFWGECARYSALKDRMLARQELVAPMMAAELRSAMEQQAAKVGLRFEADLSNSMLDEVAGEPGAMPLLQHALLELWKHRHGRWLRAEEYRAIGGVKQAIAETADRLYNEASTAEQDEIRDIFVRLTQIDDNVVRGEERRDTRRRLNLAEVLPAGGDPAQIRAFVKRLADNVLVVTSRNELTGQEELEVSHEALIRHWARLRKWLNDDLIGLRLRDRVSDAVREWKKNPDDESLLVHRGSRLAAAENLLINRRLLLTAEERDYLKRCREREDAERDEKEAARQAEIKRQQDLADAAIKLANEQRRRAQQAIRTERGLDLSQRGWGAIFVQNSQSNIHVLLRKLLDHRRNSAGSKYLELTYQPGETAQELLARYGADKGALDPIPYYLLIVGSPEQIPYSVQYELASNHAAGRIFFERPEQYSAYADNVVSAETDAYSMPATVLLFGPTHQLDQATALTANNLLKPIANSLEEERWRWTQFDWSLTEVIGESATKSKLSEILSSGKPPALLFLAAHGMSFSKDHPRQKEDAGAILCADYKGPPGPVQSEMFFAASDVGAEIDLTGTIVFAAPLCFGAGTPRYDDFSLSSVVQNESRELASRELMSKLPMQLLGVPNRGALAFIGHVDRCWSFSITGTKKTDSPDRPPPPGLFSQVLGQLMNGYTIGLAMDGFRRRVALNATLLISRLAQSLTTESRELVNQKLATFDVRNYVIIGDPAVSSPARRIELG
jgi:hypothetical protein